MDSPVVNTPFPVEFSDPETWGSPESEAVSSLWFSKSFFSLFSIHFTREFCPDELDHPVLNQLYETLRARDDEASSRRFFLDSLINGVDMAERADFANRFFSVNPILSRYSGADFFAEDPLWAMLSLCLHLTPWSVIHFNPYETVYLIDHVAPKGFLDCPTNLNLRRETKRLERLTMRIINAVIRMEPQVFAMSQFPPHDSDSNSESHSHPPRRDSEIENENENNQSEGQDDQGDQDNQDGQHNQETQETQDNQDNQEHQEDQQNPDPVPPPPKGDLSWRHSPEGREEAEYLWTRLDKIYVILSHWRTVDKFSVWTCRAFYHLNVADDDDEEFSPWDCPGMKGHVLSVIRAMFEPDMLPAPPHVFHPKESSTNDGDDKREDKDSLEDSDSESGNDGDDDDKSSLFDSDRQEDGDDTDLSDLEDNLP